MRHHAWLLWTILATGNTACTGCGEGLRLQDAVLSLEVSPESLDFGTTYLGVPVSRVLTLTNRGNATVRLDRVEVTGSGAFLMEGPPPTVVDAGQSLRINVVFTPESSGAHAALIQVESNAADHPAVTIALTGEARPIPTCDDGNPCTFDQFELTADQCVYVNREGSCDDGNACTQQDACVDGRCVGSALNCDDRSICTRDACDAQRGCIWVPDTSVCADQVPCTADLCDPVTGCSHVPAPDGTPCGPIDGCATMRLCASGACGSFPVPEGFPCNDGDFCSVGDRCQAGGCVGLREDRPPVIEAVLETYSGSGVAFAALPGGRVALVDQPQLSAMEPSLTRPQRLSLVQVTNAGLQRLAGVSLPLETGSVDDLLFWEGRLLLMETTPGRGLALQVWDVPATNVPVLLGRFMLPGLGVNAGNELHPATVVGNVLYICTYGYALLPVDLSVPDAPVASSTPLALPNFCREVHQVDQNRLLLWQQTSDWGHLTVVDIREPMRPVQGTTPAGVFGSRPYKLSSSGPHLVVGYVAEGPSLGLLGSIEILDRTTLGILGRMDFPTATRGAAGMAAVGNGLLVTTLNADGTDVRLLHYDLSNPATPQADADLLLLPERGYNNVGHLLASDGVALLQTEWARGPLLFHLTADGQPTVQTAPDHGALMQLAPVGDALYAVHTGGVRRLDVPSQGPPVFLGGGTFSQAAKLVRISQSVAVDVPVEPEFLHTDPLTLQSSAFPLGRLPWMDATDINAPRMLASLWPDLRSRVWRARGNVMMAVAWSSPTEGEATLERHITGGPLPVQQAEFVASASVALVPIEPFNFASHMLPPALGLSLDASRVAVVFHREGTFPNIDPAELHVFRFANGVLRPTAKTQAAPDVYLRSVGVELNTVVTLENVDTRRMGPGGPRLPNPLPAALGVYTLDEVNGTLTRRGQVALPPSTHLLNFDGLTALVSTETGVAFVDVFSAVPRLLGTVDTPQMALDAEVYLDKLVVNGPTGLVVVSPPCPPPSLP